jgi:hypothetical protein
MSEVVGEVLNVVCKALCVVRPLPIIWLVVEGKNEINIQNEHLYQQLER